MGCERAAIGPGKQLGLGFSLVLAASLAAACDVPEHDPGTGGIDAASQAECARGMVVVSSDYLSTNVSLLALDGSVLSASLISSGSAPPGLAPALGGDVVVPTMRAEGDSIVLIDRYPASVLTWVDLQTAEVSAQLSVATGFAANPHDYVELSSSKAYVPRFEPNFASGREPFDEGNDVLVIDPSVPEITGRIDLSEAMSGEDPRYLPRADRAVLVDGRLIVILGAYTADTLDSAPSRLVAIDTVTDSIDGLLVLEGLHGCAGLAMSPDRDELAVACSGKWEGSVGTLAQSGIVRVAIGSGLEEIERYGASSFGEGPVGAGVSYAGSGRLVLTTFGRFADGDSPAADDTVVELDLDSGTSRVLLRSDETPFTLGDVSCDSSCQACFLTDAAREGGVVHRFDVTPDGLEGQRTIKVETSVGLPPRYLGQF